MNHANPLFSGVLAEKERLARKALARVPQVEIQRWLADFHAAANAFAALTVKDRLDRFRAEVGEDHYQAIAAGPSLGELLSFWEQRTKLAIGERAVDRLMDLAAVHPSKTPLDRSLAAAYFGTILMRAEARI